MADRHDVCLATLYTTLQGHIDQQQKQHTELDGKIEKIMAFLMEGDGEHPAIMILLDRLVQESSRRTRQAKLLYVGVFTAIGAGVGAWVTIIFGQ